MKVRPGARLLLRIAAASAMIALPGRAPACRSSDNHTALIHNGVPRPYPRGTIVALVEFERATDWRVFQRGARARVRRMVQGAFRGRYLLVRATGSSCSHPFENGTSGLIVAVPAGTRDGMLVVDAIEVPRQNGYRLRGNYRLPPGMRRD